MLKGCVLVEVHNVCSGCNHRVILLEATRVKCNFAFFASNFQPSFALRTNAILDIWHQRPVMLSVISGQSLCSWQVLIWTPCNMIYNQKKRVVDITVYFLWICPPYLLFLEPHRTPVIGCSPLPVGIPAEAVWGRPCHGRIASCWP